MPGNVDASRRNRSLANLLEVIELSSSTRTTTHSRVFSLSLVSMLMLLLVLLLLLLLMLILLILLMLLLLLLPMLTSLLLLFQLLIINTEDVVHIGTVVIEPRSSIIQLTLSPPSVVHNKHGVYVLTGDSVSFRRVICEFLIYGRHFINIYFYNNMYNNIYII